MNVKKISRFSFVSFLVFATLAGCATGLTAKNSNDAVSSKSSTGMNADFQGEAMRAPSALGPGSSGGGDPDASEFAFEAREFALWSSRYFPVGGLKPQGIRDLADLLIRSLDGRQKAKIIFTEEVVKDVHGTTKFARYDRTDKSILVNRPSWKSLSEVDKYDLVGMELFGLLGIGERYFKARTVAEEIVAVTGEQSNQALVMRAIRNELEKSHGPLSGARSAFIEKVKSDQEGTEPNKKTSNSINLFDMPINFHEISEARMHASTSFTYLVSFRWGVQFSAGEQIDTELVIRARIENNVTLTQNGDLTSAGPEVHIVDWRIVDSGQTQKALGFSETAN